MERRGTSVIQPQEVRATERKMSDEEVSNLLAAFGNHEAKALTLLLMRPHTIYSRSDIHRQVMEVQGENPAWRMNWAGPFAYCTNSLAPIGLVTREVIDRSIGTFGYEKTEYGERVGDPLAALLLDYSLKHDFSLYQIFGPTMTSGPKSSDIEIKGEKTEFKNRSPLRRLKILRALLSMPLPTREADILGVANANQGIISNHLQELSRAGIITLETVIERQSFSLYRLSPNKPEGRPEKYQTYPTLTQKVYDVIVSDPNKSWTIEEIFEKLRKLGTTKKYVDVVISRIAQHLIEKGYLERGIFKGNLKTQINLEDRVRLQLIDLTELIDAFQNQDPEVLERGMTLIQKFRAGHMEIEIRRLMQKAKDNSPAINKRPPEETGLFILSIIQDGSPKTIREIQDLLERQYDRKLNTGSIWGLLHKLKDKGLVVPEKGKVVRWNTNLQASN